MIALAPLIVVHLLALGQLTPQQQAVYKQAQEIQRTGKVPSAKDNPNLANGKAPKTCDDQCDFMDKMMKDTCAKGVKKSPAGAKSCRDNASKMVANCLGSCREKGKIDGDYMKAHTKKPKGRGSPSGPSGD